LGGRRAFAVFGWVTAIASLLVLPATTYIAGQWTGQRWLLIAGLLVSGFQLSLSFLIRQVVQGAFDGGWGRGSLTMGEYIGVLLYIQRFAYALVIGALVLVVARSARDSRVTHRP